jgi:hypothetical protein
VRSKAYLRGRLKDGVADALHLLPEADLEGPGQLGQLGDDLTVERETVFK